MLKPLARFPEPPPLLLSDRALGKAAHDRLVKAIYSQRRPQMRRPHIKGQTHGERTTTG